MTSMDDHKMKFKVRFHSRSHSIKSAYPVHTQWVICLCLQPSRSAQTASHLGFAERCTLLRYGSPVVCVLSGTFGRHWLDCWVDVCVTDGDDHK